MIAISIAASCPQGLMGLILCCSFARNPLPWLGGIRAVLHLLPIKLVPISLLSTLLLGRFSSTKLRCALRQALARFQLRNGMRSDGELTAKTIERLNISVGERIAVMALNPTTCTGVLRLTMVPSPNWPELFWPHASTVPSPLSART